MGDSAQLGGLLGGDDSSSGQSPQSQSTGNQPSLQPILAPEDFPIVRLPSESDDLSAVIGVKLLGYVSVRILFLDVPVKGLKLTIDDASGVPQIPDQNLALQRGWTANDPNMTTDDDGCCTLGMQAPIGTYTCKIERQDPALITTVEDPSRPFVLVLPIGRPYNDIYLQP
jgi:hypothetical protein